MMKWPMVFFGLRRFLQALRVCTRLIRAKLGRSIIFHRRFHTRRARPLPAAQARRLHNRGELRSYDNNPPLWPAHSTWAITCKLGVTAHCVTHCRPPRAASSAIPCSAGATSTRSGRGPRPQRRAEVERTGACAVLRGARHGAERAQRQCSMCGYYFSPSAALSCQGPPSTRTLRAAAMSTTP